MAPKGQLRANNGQALRAAALEGLGIVLLPEALLADDLAAGRLVRLLSGHAPPPRPLHLLTLANRRPTPKLRSFVKVVAERLGVQGAAEAGGSGLPSIIQNA